MQTAVLKLNHPRVFGVANLNPHGWRGGELERQLVQFCPHTILAKPLELRLQWRRIRRRRPIRKMCLPKCPQMGIGESRNDIELDAQNRLHNGGPAKRGETTISLVGSGFHHRFRFNHRTVASRSHCIPLYHTPNKSGRSIPGSEHGSYFTENNRLITSPFRFPRQYQNCVTQVGNKVLFRFHFWPHFRRSAGKSLLATPSQCPPSPRSPGSPARPAV